ncbi:MAG: carbohydrate binding domain-containing protein [Oscillospiraceae bacterium]|nr:carbohydrate binding domain-containing protein [Oscillospiraceae bacterium]
MKFSLKKAAAVLVSSVTCMTAFSAITTLPAVTAAGNCTIDLSTEYQTIQGFGGINHPEWVGDLTESQRIKAYNNGADQLGFSILRVFVNPDKNQWSKAVATAKYAQSQGATIFASPWEPPSYMTESGSGTRPSGKLHLKKQYYEAYANHLNDFVLYMKSQGVNIYAISVQNEPDYAEEWTTWTSDETTEFIANYGHLISCKLMSPETFQYTNKDYYSKILNNQKAFANCDIFGTHFYGTQRSQMNFDALESCGKPIWMTEVYVPNSSANSGDNWPEALQVAENMHNGLVVGNMSAYVWWTIRRSYGPMKEDGNISKRGYMMAQYSKYVRPGDVRIGATESPENNILVSAYKNDEDQVKIVAINKNSSTNTETFNLSGIEGISNISAYQTNGSANLKTISATANGKSFSAQLPAQSVTTFVIDTKEEEPDPNGYLFHYTFENGEDGFTGRSATVAQSASEAYEGSKSLECTGRTSSWNGATHDLNSKFKAGEEYSFSAIVKYTSGLDTDTFHFSVEYKDASGETQYDKIATETVPKGEWVQLANTAYKIPAGATNVKIYVETADTTNDFYVDEVIGAPKGTVIDGPHPVIIKVKLGDLNGDDKITAVDMSMAKAGMRSGFSSAALEKAADVDCSGTVDLADIEWYAEYLTGQTKDFPEAKVVEQPPRASMRTISEYTPVVQQSVAISETNDSTQKKNGVDYGTLEKKSYFSKFCGRDKKYNVLLPANYSTSKKYPVLYVMHGYYEDQDRMILTGNAPPIPTQQIIGNAIAEKAAEEMIVVFPYIYSSQTQNDCNGMNDANNQAYDNFETVLITELMPLIESTYSVATGRENTAITGFSMGGRESLNIGTRHADLFGYVGAICPAPGASPKYKYTSEADAPSLIFITAGGNDEVVYTTPEGYHNDFTKNSVPHIWHYYQAGYHGDNSIRAHIYNFVRVIFKA